ncbi:MAG: hypothetical protein ABEJ42_09175 [Halobacteriaceae archaeon]
MGMRPPPANEGTNRPEAVDFGIAALDAELDDADLSFPTTGDEVVAALDDPDVPYDIQGSTVPLSTALEQCRRETFESKRDLLDALHPVFEEFRTSRRAGVLGWLRSRLPF